MNDAERGRVHADIHTGDISGSSGIVIGHGSSASVGPARPPAQQQTIDLLSGFVRLLDSFEGAVPDVSDVRDAAEAAKAEAEGPSPRWGVIRGLLKGIAAAVAGVASLTDAVRNIQDLVAHLARLGTAERSAARLTSAGATAPGRAPALPRLRPARHRAGIPRPRRAGWPSCTHRRRPGCAGRRSGLYR